MRSALWSEVGGALDGTVTLGAWPAVPAGDWSAAGMGTMASSGLCPGTVVAELGLALLAAFVLVVAPEPDGLDDEELQAARPSAPAAAIASARVQKRGVRED